MVKNIFRRVWSIWFIFWMVGILTLFFPFYYVFLLRKTYIGHRLGYALNWLWTVLLLNISMIPITVRGRKQIDKKKTYMYVCNHSSFLDIPLCTVVTPQFFRFIGKKSLAKAPMFGYLYKRLHILVDRNDKSSRGNAVFLMTETLKANESMLIYPEGTRINDPNNRLAPFQDGGVRAAIEAGVPVVPMTLINTKVVLPEDGKFLVLPFKRVYVIFDAPIPTTGLSLADAPELSEKVRSIIQNNIDQYHAGK